MGIIKWLVEFVASDALISASDVAIKSIEKTSDNAEKKAEKKRQKVLGSNPGHMYYVDITDPKDEFYCVLITLALDSASMSKHEETKRTVKKETILSDRLSVTFGLRNCNLRVIWCLEVLIGQIYWFWRLKMDNNW